MTETAPAPARPAARYWLTRFVMLRLLGAVYAVAFFVAARQILPLIGSHGLTPLNLYLARVQLRWILGPSKSRKPVALVVEAKGIGPLAAAIVGQ